MNDTKYAELRRKIEQSYRKYKLTRKNKYRNAHNNRLKEMKEYLASEKGSDFENVYTKMSYLGE